MGGGRKKGGGTSNEVRGVDERGKKKKPSARREKVFFLVVALSFPLRSLPLCLNHPLSLTATCRGATPASSSLGEWIGMRKGLRERGRKRERMRTRGKGEREGSTRRRKGATSEWKGNGASPRPGGQTAPVSYHRPREIPRLRPDGWSANQIQRRRSTEGSGTGNLFARGARGSKTPGRRRRRRRGETPRTHRLVSLFSASLFLPVHGLCLLRLLLLLPEREGSALRQLGAERARVPRAHRGEEARGGHCRCRGRHRP